MQTAPVHSDSNLGFGDPAAKGDEVTDLVALVDTGLAIRGYSPLMQAALLDIQHIDEIYSKIIKEARECMVIPPLLMERYRRSTEDRTRPQQTLGVALLWKAWKMIQLEEPQP